MAEIDADDLRPHTGAQEAFLSNPADIVIGGGQAGGGKTYALLLEPLRHIHVPGFSAVIFRRTYRQLEMSGGPWPESLGIYSLTEGVPTYMKWRWPESGAIVKFGHIQHDKNRLDYKGAQITMLGFDQLEDFLESQFWYLLSRNRSLCGVRPYVRATCNPVPPDDPTGGWLHKLIGWWIGEDGFPLLDRAGRLRWFVREGDDLMWADSAEELAEAFPGRVARSLSFVPMRLEDNPTLMRLDPGYQANLETLPYVERMRLRHGNWLVRAVAGTLFKREWFGVVDQPPQSANAMRCRFWDCASTAGGGDWTAGVKVAKHPDGRWVVEDVVRGRWSPAEVERVIRVTAEQDGRGVRVREEQEGGSSGKAVTMARARMLAGWDYRGVPATGDKATRWRPFAAQAEAGHVVLVRATWNDAFLAEADAAPEGFHDDQLDAVAGAFNDLAALPRVAQMVKLSGF